MFDPLIKLTFHTCTLNHEKSIIPNQVKIFIFIDIEPTHLRAHLKILSYPASLRYLFPINSKGSLTSTKVHKRFIKAGLRVVVYKR